MVLDELGLHSKCIEDFVRFSFVENDEVPVSPRKRLVALMTVPIWTLAQMTVLQLRE
jgi:hypothetical protein